MTEHDWTCHVCSQPNSADAIECINCVCPMHASIAEIKQLKSSYLGATMGTQSLVAPADDTYISPDGRLTTSTPPLNLVPETSTTAVGLIVSIVLRTLWLGMFIPVAIVWFFGIGLYAHDAHGLLGAIYMTLSVVMYILVVIPAISIGLMPLSLIDKKPLLVRVFYRGTIPIIIVGLLLRGLLTLYAK